MSGRDRFARAKPFIGALVSILRLVPARIVQSSWWIVRGMPGVLGVLFRYVFFARLVKACGDNVMIGPGCHIQGWGEITVGSNVTIHLNTYIDAIGGLYIGDNVSIAHACSILTFEHGWANSEMPIKYNPLALSSVSIGNDVWVGCGVRILAGVSIGERVVVAAGSVVKRGAYEAGVYAGVPATLKKALM